MFLQINFTENTAKSHSGRNIPPPDMSRFTRTDIFVSQRQHAERLSQIRIFTAGIGCTCNMNCDGIFPIFKKFGNLKTLCDKSICTSSGKFTVYKNCGKTVKTFKDKFCRNIFAFIFKLSGKAPFKELIFPQLLRIHLHIRISDNSAAIQIKFNIPGNNRIYTNITICKNTVPRS